MVMMNIAWDLELCSFMLVALQKNHNTKCYSYNIGESDEDKLGQHSIQLSHKNITIAHLAGAKPSND